MTFSSNYSFAATNGKMITNQELEQVSFVEPMIYEVIRVIQGKPLFYQEHMTRLSESAKLIGKSVDIWLPQIEADIRALIQDLILQDDNLKIVIGNWDKEVPSWLIFGVKGFYPPKDWYHKGIKTTLFRELRQNPQAKVINETLAQRVDQLRQTTDYFEALLVDQENRITEGSRSNIVFIKGNTLIMPRAELALKGITRLKLLQAIKELNIEWKEMDVVISDLDSMDGLFITGTSIDLLPVAEVDSFHLNTSQLPIMNQLLEKYRMLMQVSLNEFDHR